MNEKDVTYFSTLLNLPAEDVEKAIEDGLLGEKLSASVMTKDQVEKMKVNYAKEIKSGHISELTEAAKKGELDPDLYKVIKGASYEMLEKDLAKEYGVNDFDGVKDLVAKAIKNNTAKPDDKKLHELTDKIEKLQQANEKLLTEKDEAVQSAKSEYETRLLNREKSDFVKTVPFDFSDVEEKELERIASQRQKIITDVFDARFNLTFDDDKIIVKSKDGSALTNEATLEPIPVSDVLKNLASELGIKLKSPESGGQGGRSSGKNGKVQFKDADEFKQYCEENNIKPTSNRGIELWAASRQKS